MDEDKFWSMVNKDGPLIIETPCWVWTKWTRSGYGVFMGRRGGKRTTISAHRYAWELENGEIPASIFLCHRCDNRICVRPSHIFLGTQKDNMEDAAKKGRMPSILASEQVIAARKRAARGESIHSINKAIGVKTLTLSNAIRGITFKHVDHPPVEKINFAKHSPHSVLTAEQVAEVKEALKNPYWGQMTALAAKYGVRRQVIGNIARGRTHRAS